MLHTWAGGTETGEVSFQGSAAFSLGLVEVTRHSHCRKLFARINGYLATFQKLNVDAELECVH